MELLQEALPSLKIKEAAYTRVEASAPWGLDFIPYHHTKFGIVSEGVCHIDLKNGEPPVRLARGSCYLLTRGDAFRLRDAALSHTTPFEHALQHLQGRLLRWGGDGDKTTIIGGRFVFASNRYPHLLDLLPPLIHFTVSEQELRGLVSTIELLGNETSHPSSGSNIMVDRLADLFFIQSLRAYWRSDAQQQVGWIGAVADEKLSRTLGPCTNSQSTHGHWRHWRPRPACHGPFLPPALKQSWGSPPSPTSPVTVCNRHSSCFNSHHRASRRSLHRSVTAQRQPLTKRSDVSLACLPAHFASS